VALLCTASLFYALATIARNKPIGQQWRIVAQWNLWIGIAITGFTVLFGWLAFNSVNHDEMSHELMVEHRNWALITTAAFAILGLWSIKYRNGKRYPSWIFAGFMVAASGSLFITAYHGGDLVYGHGLAVNSLPKTENSQSITPSTNQTMPEQSTPDNKEETGNHHHHTHHD
jgi:uncharacterized membrane protein